MSSVRPSPAKALLAGLLALLVFAPGAWAAPGRPLEVPAAGEIAWHAVAARTQPSMKAKRVALLDQFYPDFRRRVVLALEVRTNAQGKALWYRISLPGRPNGRTGWVPAAALRLQPMRRELVVYRGARRLELREGGRVLFRARVAVGRPGRETPLGTFYVTGRFQPADPFLGSFAFSTSAYSRMTDWPGGGIVGIHGTSMPQLIGQAVSSGCIRLANRDVLALKQRVGLGTVVRIVA